MQIAANEINLPVQVVAGEAASALGVAYAAAMDVGMFSDWSDITRFISQGPIYSSQSALVPRYRQSFALYRELSTRLPALVASWVAGYDELAGIGWDWQSVDGSTVKAPFAQAAVGPAPTDRGKQGTKRSILCDRRGIPLALVIEAFLKLACALIYFH